MKVVSTVRGLWILLLTAVLIGGCGNPAADQGQAKRERTDLVNALRSKGIIVDTRGSVEQPFLHPRSGTRFQLTGGSLSGPAEIQIYEYDSTKDVTADASSIRPDGSGAANVIVEWIAPPHFFAKGHILVIFVGTDPSLTQVLTDELGPQFAGG